MQAFYDHKPSILEAVGNGSYRYRYNIEEVTPEVTNDNDNDTNTTEEQSQWRCEEVIVWMPLTANKITEAVIVDNCDLNREQKLVNEYNAAKEGLYDDETATSKIIAYTTYLTERTALKAQVDKDCEALGIK